MKIEINIEKKHFYFLMIFIGVLFVIGVSAYVNPTTKVGHGPEEIGPGTFGAQETNPVFTFPWNLNVNNLLTVESINLNDVERNSWPEGVPSGFCVFSDTATSCPIGWTKRATTTTDNFYGRTIRGSASGIGQKGGSNTHSHELPSLAAKCDSCDCGGNCRAIVNQAGKFTLAANTWPPYVNVTICCKT